MEMRHYLNLLRRKTWLILIAMIISGGSAYLVSKNTAPTYQASTRLLIDEAPGSNAGNEYAQLLLEQQLAGTYVELLQTRPVLEKTIAELGLNTSVDALASEISVSTPQDSKILGIQVRNHDSNRAAAIANTLAQVFIQDNEERQSQRYAESIQKRQQLLDDLADQIEALETEISSYGEVDTPERQAAYDRLQTNLRETQIKYTQNFQDLEDLRLEQARGSNNLLVVEKAIPPSTPIRPRVGTNTALAVAAGAIAALGLIFTLEYLDDSVKTPEQIEEDTGLPTLGFISEIGGKNGAARVITLHEPRAPVSEAFRGLRTNLGFTMIDASLQTVAISSAVPGEGKSTITANLGVVMAQAGKSLVVIDADLRLSRQHHLFNLSNNHGLTSAILDQDTPVRQYLQSTSMPGLCVLTSGPLPPNPSELLNSQRMSQVLQSLGEEFDLLIVDTPPLLTVTDAAIVGTRVDGCLIVVEAGATRRVALAHATENLAKAGARVLGAVLNRMQAGSAGNYDIYYNYYHQEYDAQGRRVNAGKSRRLPDWLSGLSNRS